MKNEKEEILDINQLAGGAIQEAIHFALGEVFENIKDPNTEAEKARKLTIVMELKPDEYRQVIKTKTTCKTSLVPTNSITTSLFLDKNGENVVATELFKQDPNQIAFDELTTKEENEEEKNNVIEMNKEAK